MNRMDDLNAVLHARATEHHWRGAGLLSIKSFSGGSAIYHIDGGTFRVDDEHFLIANHGQEYEITIDSDTPVESFCVFFDSALASDVLNALTHSTEALLDQPFAPSSAMLFFERTYPHDTLLTPALDQFRRAYPQRGRETGWLDEQYHSLLRRLVSVHERTAQEADRLSNARAATRAELYRRLHRARDYISATYERPIALKDVAAVACLSPNHLLRSFKAAFGITPYQFLIDERLRQARWLLAHTDRSVTDICFAVGYESLGSFSWRFTQRYGLSPQAFRLLNQSGD